VGRVLPLALQHAKVRYPGNDSYYTGKLTSGSEKVMPENGQEESLTVLLAESS
jgi:hypothetical protein